MATICEKKKNQSFTDIRKRFYQSPTQDRMTLELCVAWQIKQLDNKVVDLAPPPPKCTWEHCCSTSSLNRRNPSWIAGWLRGNDRKCVKGCFFRKLSTRTSTRVTADETADLLGAVITVSKRRWWGRYAEFIFSLFSKLKVKLLFPTDLSFHSLFRDADGCLCVKLKTLACLPLFSNYVSKEQKVKDIKIRYAYKEGKGKYILKKNRVFF